MPRERLGRVEVYVTITVNEETRTIDLKDCEVTVQPGLRAAIPGNDRGYRTYEKTDDLSVTIIGKRS